MIVAGPADTPVTTPFASTVAVVSSLELKVYGSRSAELVTAIVSVEPSATLITVLVILARATVPLSVIGRIAAWSFCAVYLLATRGCREPALENMVGVGWVSRWVDGTY